MNFKKSIFTLFLFANVFVLSYAQTYPPACLNPVNGDTVNLHPTFTWCPDTMSYSFGYNIQISTNSSFTNIILDDTTYTNSYHLSSNVLSVSYYYWRVAAYDTLLINGPFSSANFFYTDTAGSVPANPAVGAPTCLQFPGNGDTTQIHSAYIWCSGNNAVKYHLEISSDPSFTNILVSDSTSSTMYTLNTNALAPNSYYYWRVKSADASYNQSTYTNYNFFYVVDSNAVAPLSQAIITSPGFGASNIVTTPLITWTNPDAPIDSFRVIVQYMGLDTSIYYFSTVKNQYRLPAGILGNNETYYVSIESYKSAQMSLSSLVDFSTTSAVPPVDPIVVSANGDTTIVVNPSMTPTITINWTPNPNVTTYCFQISRDSLFTSISIDSCGISGSGFTINFNTANLKVAATAKLLSGGTDYYWRVAGTNAGGNTPWSPVSTLNVQSVTPISVKQKEVQLSLYPNPSQGQFMIQLPGNEEIIDVTITDILGKEEHFTSSEIVTNLRGLVSVKVTGKTNSYISKVIVR